TKIDGTSSRAKAMSAPGMFLSQPPTARTPSIDWPLTTVSIESAITSRETSEYFMPSVPIEMPSATVIVPKTWGMTPASRSAAIARSDSVAIPALQGVRLLWAFATPTIGFWKAASSKPTARSIERLGARMSPSVMALLRLSLMSPPANGHHTRARLAAPGGGLARVKGTAVQSSLRYVRERFGEAPLAAVLEALGEADRRALEGVLASAWYEVPLFLRFMLEAERQLGTQQPQLVRNMGRASCDYGLTTVYKIFFKIGSPEFIIGRAARVFSSYSDT